MAEHADIVWTHINADGPTEAVITAMDAKAILGSAAVKPGAAVTTTFGPAGRTIVVTSNGGVADHFDFTTL